MAKPTLSKRDFETLSQFRYRLRRFLRFSEQATRAHGITPLQYLLLLHIKGYPGREWARVGELAGWSVVNSALESGRTSYPPYTSSSHCFSMGRIISWA